MYVTRAGVKHIKVHSYFNLNRNRLPVGEKGKIFFSSGTGFHPIYFCFGKLFGRGGGVFLDLLF